MNEEPVSASRPRYPGPSLGTRIALAWVAISCSSLLLTGGLGLFEIQSRATAGARAHPTPGAASGALTSASLEDRWRG